VLDISCQSKWGKQLLQLSLSVIELPEKYQFSCQEILQSFTFL